MHSKKEDFKLFSRPFHTEPELLIKDFQMELIEPQSNEFYKSKLSATGTSVIEFYKKYLDKSKSFPNLIDHTKQLFSKIKYIKSKSQSQLIDGYLDSLLTHSNITTDLVKLSC